MNNLKGEGWLTIEPAFHVSTKLKGLFLFVFETDQKREISPMLV